MKIFCGPILLSFFFNMTMRPNKLPTKPKIIVIGAKYFVENQLFHSNDIFKKKISCFSVMIYFSNFRMNIILFNYLFL